LKSKFRRVITKLRVLEDSDIDMDKIIFDILNNIPNKFVKNFAKHGRKMIAGKNGSVQSDEDKAQECD